MGPDSAAVPAALGSETVASLAAAASRCCNPIPRAPERAPLPLKTGAGSAGAVSAASAEVPAVAVEEQERERVVHLDITSTSRSMGRLCLRSPLHACPGVDQVPDGGITHPALAGRHHDHQTRQGARAPDRGGECGGVDEGGVSEQPQEQHRHHPLPGEAGHGQGEVDHDVLLGLHSHGDNTLRQSSSMDIESLFLI